MKYIKDNTILNEGQSFVIDNKRVINPKHQDYIDAGFGVYVEPTIEIIEPTEEEKLKQEELMFSNEVERLIREKYSLSDELALSRQRDVKIQEFDDYYNYCEDCKKQALINLGIINNSTIVKA